MKIKSHREIAYDTVYEYMYMKLWLSSPYYHSKNSLSLRLTEQANVSYDDNHTTQQLVIWPYGFSRGYTILLMWLVTESKTCFIEINE